MTSNTTINGVVLKRTRPKKGNGMQEIGHTAQNEGNPERNLFMENLKL